MMCPNRSSKPLFILLILLALIVGSAMAFSHVLAATIIVNTVDDTTTAGDGNCSLREAITNANVNGDITEGDCVTGEIGADSIVLPAGTYTLTSQLLITSEIVINGDDAETTIIQASTCNPITLPGGCTPAANYPVFSMTGVSNLTLNNLTVRYGNVIGYGGGISNYSGFLTITNSIISENFAGLRGGGIYINSINPLDISDSSLSGNVSQEDGGGIFIDTGTPAVITNSIINGNSSPRYCGGICNRGTLEISGTTISENAAEYGGGIKNMGVATLTISDSNLINNQAFARGGGIDTSVGGSVNLDNSTLSGNSSDGNGGGIFIYTDASLDINKSTLSGNTSASDGGGIYNYLSNSIYITNSTLSGNSSTDQGGGIFNYANSTVYITNSTLSANSAATSGGGIYNNGTLYYVNTIIANSTSGADCFNTGTIDTNITNLVENNAESPNHCGTPFLHEDPMLTPLADNGGFTLTHALLAGSPAIDVANPTLCLATDQRGVARPQGGGCDIGAFEMAQVFLPLVLK